MLPSAMLRHKTVTAARMEFIVDVLAEDSELTKVKRHTNCE